MMNLFRVTKLTSHCILALTLSCILTVFLYPSGVAVSADNAPEKAFLGLNEEIALLQKRVTMASPGVVSVTIYDNTGEKINNGSGFFIDRDGKIITNSKILEDAFSAEVKSNSRTYDLISILAIDEQTGLAMIRVNATNEYPLELGFNASLALDEKVLMIGKTESLRDTVAEGTITLIDSKAEPAQQIEIKKTIPITSFQDNVDGPVLNNDGKVIGIQTVISEHSIFGKDALLLDDKRVTAIGIKSVYSLLSGQTPVELHKAGTSEVSAVLKKYLATAFIFLYGIGFPKLLGILFALVIFISLFKWIYFRIRKTFK